MIKTVKMNYLKVVLKQEELTKSKALTQINLVQMIINEDLIYNVIFFLFFYKIINQKSYLLKISFFFKFFTQNYEFD